MEGVEDEGRFLALTTTSSGEPVVAFYDATLRDVQVSRRFDLNSWEEDDIAESGDVGRLVTLLPKTVSPNAADVAYFDATNGTIVQRSGSYDAWNQTTTIASGFAVASLSYADSSGSRRVAYYDSLAGDLLLARLGPGGTSVVAVDQTGDVGRSCSVGVTSDGVTHIVYYDATVGRLRHARATPTGWTFLTIASGPDVGRRCALGAKGLALKVAFYDAGNGDLHWAIWNGTAWSTGLVDAAGDVGSGCSVGLDDVGDMSIAYFDATNADLKYARVYSAGFLSDVGTVDAVGDVGRFSAVAIDPTTRLAEIVYYRADIGQMKYAKQMPATSSVDDVREAREWLRVGPNPIRKGGDVRIECSLQTRAVGEISLFDVSGRLVGAVKGATLGGDSAPIVIGVPASTSGMLFVRVRLQTGGEEVFRTVVLP